ncbi:MAG: putative metal-dependent enzyme (double-stranded beta helix superfamily) [Glaciecola sp.]|jgi:predicted metal-dependent enzyme (double-stranded beta helix superfamily)
MQNPPSTFERLISQLSELEDTLPNPQEVANILSKADISAAELRPLLNFRKNGYTRNLVHRSQTFDVIVLCWAPNSGTPIHDHGDQLGWVRVLKGALEEVRFSTKGQPTKLDENTTWTPLVHSRKVQPADRSVDWVDKVHGIHQLKALDMQTISLHIYSKPIDTCLVFAGEEGEINLKELEFDTTPDSRSKQLS